MLIISQASRENAILPRAAGSADVPVALGEAAGPAENRGGGRGPSISVFRGGEGGDQATLVGDPTSMVYIWAFHILLLINFNPHPSC